MLSEKLTPTLSELLDAISPRPSENIDEKKKHLLSDGAPCVCPPACSRTTYSAAQSFADFPSKTSKVMEELIREEQYKIPFGEAV